ncbi:MAG: hypothetical protein Q9222_002859, partial [Ikaeria aurantiellina]
ALSVSETDVVNMNRRLAAPDHSLNAPVRADSEGEWQDWLVDDSENQEVVMADREEMTGRRALLDVALKTLNERERHILIERRLKDNPTTLEELSQQYNISRERVRQIEVRAFEKLQKSMRNQVVERRQAVAQGAARLYGVHGFAGPSRDRQRHQPSHDQRAFQHRSPPRLSVLPKPKPRKLPSRPLVIDRAALRPVGQTANARTCHAARS